MFGPLTVKPANSKGDKTGSWRTQSRPEYLHKNCIACRMCLIICPRRVRKRQGEEFLLGRLQFLQRLRFMRGDMPQERYPHGRRGIRGGK